VWTTQGRAAVSASGFVLDAARGIVVTCASVVAPFLQRPVARTDRHTLTPDLVDGTTLWVHLGTSPSATSAGSDPPRGAPAQLLAVCECVGTDRRVPRPGRRAACTVGLTAGGAPLDS
jgi:hypothetical protein